jgi:hypothetical protein
MGIYRINCEVFGPSRSASFLLFFVFFLLTLLYLVAAAQAPAQTTITIGETAVLSVADGGNANLLLTQNAALSQAGTIQSLSFYVTTASGQLGLGIYDASGPNGGPGTLLAQTNAFTPMAGWNTASVVTPVALAAGTYWLAYLPSSNNLAFVKGFSSGTSNKYYPYDFASMAATFSMNPSSAPAHWSFYATLTPTGGGGMLVNGQCGSSNGVAVSSTPTTNLCTAGSASAVSGSGPWNWRCAGSNGGTNASCSAPLNSAGPPIFPVHVSGRHLVDQTGTPFMVVGDSPQAIINIPLTGPASMDTYFSDRQARGFNSLWVNLICDSYTGCPTNGTTYDGIPPFIGMLSGCSGGAPDCYDLTTENPAYFARMDAIINKAASYGLLLFLDPASTDGCGSIGWMQTLINNGPANVSSYGAFLGNRYKNFSNIVWMSGNDFQCYPTSADDDLAADIVSGMRSAGDTHLQTSELRYRTSSSKDDSGSLGSLMTMNGAYTYAPTYDEVLHAYNQAALPVFMQEANYEFANTCCESTTPVSQQVLRKQEYWTMLSGATGQLYGNSYTWPFPSGWPSNLDTPGTTYLGYMKNLFTSLQWYNLVPDQNHVVMIAGYGTYASSGSIMSNSYATTALASSASGTLVVAYIPTVRAVTIDITKLGSNIQAQWYDPTSGTYASIGGFDNTGTQNFTPPGNNSAGDSDWVLVLQGQPQ